MMRPASRTRLRRAVLPLVAALFALGNGRCDWDDDWNDDEDLQGREWVLKVYQRNDGPTTVPRDGAFTIEFEDRDNVSVRADCNRCSGEYDATGDRLRISTLACTRAFCTETAPFDTEYVTQLDDARSYFVEGPLLTISTGDGLLIFDRSPSRP
jgi:heat shock protein HslJ